MAPGVPKFASFRPKPKPLADQPHEPQKSEAGPKTIERRDNSEKRRRSPSPPKSKHSTPSSTTYYSDRRGDTDVLRYGVLNRYDVPAYRRYGFGHVLGLDSNQRIDREQSSAMKVYITPASGKTQERLLTNKRLAKETGGSLRFVRSQGASEDAPADFIPVSGRRIGKPTESDDGGVVEEEPDYRILQRDELPDPDTETVPDTEDVDFGSSLTRTNTELVRRTQESPEDVQAWLHLIDHQEAMLTFDRPSLELSDPMKIQLANNRISIYEEALKRVGKDASFQAQLYLGLFEDARRAWDAVKLEFKWQEALDKHPQSSELWLAYLDLVQSDFSRFKYESCRKSFLQCLGALQRSANVHVQEVLHVFVRMTRMIYDAGYQELAIAIWQALLEIRIMQKNAKNLAELEKFWENEEPRIGEVESDSTVPLLHPDPTDTIFEDFRKRESDSIRRLRYPGRSSDDVGEDDAFHAIFFADFEEYLKVFPAEVPSDLTIEAFLCFCGLPPLPHVADCQIRWWKDPFLQHCPMSSSETQKRRHTASNQFMSRYLGFFACPVTGLQISTELLFGQSFSLEEIRLEPDFVRRILKTAAEDETVGQYLLAFELQHFPSDVVKTARWLLKDRPSSQRLYHAYGLVETKRDKSEKAAQVYSMAISLGGSKTLTSPSLDLISSWVWLALDRGDISEALWRFTLYAEVCEQALLRKDYIAAISCTSLLALLNYLSAPSPDASIALTAHTHLSNYLTSHKLSSSPYAEVHAQLIANFLTYHVTHNPTVKLFIIRNNLEPLVNIFPDNTILLSLYAANEAHFTIDDRVRGLMARFPAFQEPTSVVGWAFAIHYEMLRGEIAGSTSHSIRALYKRAVDSDAAGAYSPGLWTSYLHFEIAQLGLERAKGKGKTPSRDGRRRGWERRLDEAESRVRETFYAGLRALPWCKDFAMRAFTDARDVLGEEEMWKVYRVMQEKELRLYIELE
ncbi:DUF1740-domain-containing protein [Setomelanomma holmii]|uniref:DUF1740-domain-containing protein n=1 Tax=Setomelanomma holmii TaxID=210430 RepID=A0A9P4H818_9PLEO|nr:DUF1740-domain-containing protein [Setomelanomma holmii]